MQRYVLSVIAVLLFTVCGYQSVAMASETKIHVDPRCYDYKVVVCASKKDRKIRYMEDGKIIRSFQARFGRPGYETREGIFRVYAKARMPKSTLYDVYMPYSLKFSGGQYIHFSYEFARVGYGYPYGSHGCIGTRKMSAAKWLYNNIPVGTHVVVS